VFWAPRRSAPESASRFGHEAKATAIRLRIPPYARTGPYAHRVETVASLTGSPVALRSVALTSCLA
jgi:hypothetical protein